MGRARIAITGTFRGPPLEVGFDNLDTDFGDLQDFFDGTFLDSPIVTVASNGAIITLSFEKSGTGDVRAKFLDEVAVIDCTPVATITLTAGTDTIPQINYVYIPKSTGVLTLSTSGWPTADIARVATVLCQTAATLQTNGAYKVHAWTDHTSTSAGMGHLSDINYWIRQQNATWTSGAGITVTAGAGVLDIATAIGLVLQLHQHAFPAFDTATGSLVLVVNDSVTPFRSTSDLTTITADSTGTALNKYYNLVVWGVVSEDSGDCWLMINLPDGSYSSITEAELDINATAVYGIPNNFMGVGFLIARITVKLQAGTYTEVLTTDLRGLEPSTGAGGGTGVTDHTLLTNIGTTSHADIDTHIANAIGLDQLYKRPAFRDDFTEWNSQVWESVKSGSGNSYTSSGQNETLLKVDLGLGYTRVTCGSGSAATDYCVLRAKQNDQWADIHLGEMRFRWRLVMSHSTSIKAAVGIARSNTGVRPAPCFNFVWDSAVSSNIRFQHDDNGGNTTDQDTGVAISTNFVWLELVCTSTGVEAFIDGVSVASQTTNLPAAGVDRFMHPYHYIEGASATWRSIHIDYFEVVADTTRFDGMLY